MITAIFHGSLFRRRTSVTSYLHVELVVVNKSPVGFGGMIKNGVHGPSSTREGFNYLNDVLKVLKVGTRWSS